ncbi:metallophosphoesterase family protein [Chryseobacterium populi]|uniref:Calcineurin-like phosphoesterase domain-containing protein n=1 Tax=Chryseobacterium populi TaxID=1144316 RepID=J2K6R2_9FLAO|nr:hypothetical protein [Chryseobacterium populi]EJL75905.1 hypothetical protein PMI13_00301 [Chryseobacterium populi]
MKFFLIEGNHDRISEELEAKLCFDFKARRLEADHFIFVHEFDKTEPKFQVTGHIHPGIVLNSSVKNLRLPCFVQTANQLLLPAFSEFTGLDTKNIPKGRKFFVFTDAEIQEL